MVSMPSSAGALAADFFSDVLAAYAAAIKDGCASGLVMSSSTAFAAVIMSCFLQNAARSNIA